VDASRAILGEELREICALRGRVGELFNFQCLARPVAPSLFRAFT
jgi:hypothetical protein